MAVYKMTCSPTYLGFFPLIFSPVFLFLFFFNILITLGCLDLSHHHDFAHDVSVTCNAFPPTCPAHPYLALSPGHQLVVWTSTLFPQDPVCTAVIIPTTHFMAPLGWTYMEVRKWAWRKYPHVWFLFIILFSFPVELVLFFCHVGW